MAGENVAAATTYFSASLFFLLLYVFVFYYIFTHPKERRQTFYKLLLQLSVSDCFLLLLSAFYAAPCSLLGKQIYGDVIGFYVANIDTVAFNTCQWTTILISVHRLSVVAQLQFLLDKVFSGVGLYISMGCCWGIGFLWVAVTKSLNCPKLFNEKYFYFGYTCANGTDPVVDVRLFDAMLWLSVVSAVIIAVVYAISFGLLVSSRNKIAQESTKAKRRASEKRLLYQSFVTWLALTYEMISFLIFPVYMPNFAGTTITNVGTIVNSGINPVLCLIFHPDIRQSTAYLLRCCHGKVPGAIGMTSVASWKGFTVKEKTTNHNPVVPTEQ